jgi:hypothetical protein
LQHKNPFTHPRYPITFKAHGAQSKPAWVECIQEFKEDSGNLLCSFYMDFLSRETKIRDIAIN